METTRRRIWATVIVAGCVALISVVLLVGTSYLATGVARHQLANSLAEAQAAGSFPTQTWPRRDAESIRRHGIHLFLECEVFGMAVQVEESRLAEAITPEQLRIPRSLRRRGGQHPRFRPCEVLALRLKEGDLRGRRSPRKHRYLHGLRPVVIGGGRILGAEGLQTLSRVLGVGLGLLVVVLAGLRWRSEARRSQRAEGKILWFSSLTILSAGTFLLAGVPLHARTVSHGLPNLVLFLWLLLATAANLHLLKLRSLAVVCATFGALLVALDYMIGAVPMGLALVIGTLAVQPGRMDNGDGFRRRVVLAALAYVVSVVATIAGKQIIASIYFGSEVWTAGYNQLAARSGIFQYPLSEAIGRFFDSAGNIALGYAPVGQIALVVALPISMIPFLRLFGKHSEAGTRMRQSLLALSSGTVLAWYAAFWNHAAQHAYFMISPIAWPMSVGLAVLCLRQWRRR